MKKPIPGFVWGRKLAFLGLCFVLLLSGLAAPAPRALAQSLSGSWVTPVNISHSGAGSGPMLLMDKRNNPVVIWQDDYAGYFFSRQEEGHWTPPAKMPFPYVPAPTASTSSPKLTFVVAPNNIVHALWTDQRGNLNYNHSPLDAIGTGISWIEPKMLAQSVLTGSIHIDSSGNLHITYIRTNETGEFPAGIYYRQSKDGGQNWSTQVLLYQSPYFRSLKIEAVHISMSSAMNGGSEWIYIGWDNRPRKQIFLAKSTDGGDSWGDPLEVGQADASIAFAMPSNIQIIAYNNDILLVWRGGEPGASCSQYYQWSTDGGETWETRRAMLTGISGCPQDNRLFGPVNGLFFLLTTIQDQKYLLAWDGARWSEPQLQSSLSTFEDPETRTIINLGSLNTAFMPDQNRILATGSDGPAIGDIWVTSRELGSTSDWFPKPSQWIKPGLIASGDGEILSPVIVGDKDGRIHVFWVQAVDVKAKDSRKSIYYSSWDGEKWSMPISILHSDAIDAQQLSVAIDRDGKLFVTWNDKNTNENYLAWATADRATSMAEWSELQILPSPRPAVRSPQILMDRNGFIDILYVIPLNEKRGVYFIQSQDGGKSWLGPFSVFDASAAGWEMVDQPRLASTEDGSLHAIWTRFSLPGSVGSLGLYYSSSSDNGQKWSNAVTVSDSPVMWSDLLGAGGQNINRGWEEVGVDSNLLGYQSSSDNGSTWGHLVNISSSEGDVITTSGAMDPIGNLHIAQLKKDANGESYLEYWMLQGDQYPEKDQVIIGEDNNFRPVSMALTITPIGELAAIYTGESLSADENLVKYSLFFTRRILDLPIKYLISTPAPTSTAAVTPRPTATPYSTQTPIPIPTFVSTDAKTVRLAGITLNSTWSAMLVGAILAAILVMIAFGLRLYLLRGNRR